LVRAASTRVLYHAAPPPTKKKGRPRQNGARFKGSDPSTHGEPDASWAGADDKGRAVAVRSWGGLHLKKCRDAPLTAVCVTRAAAAGTTRDPRATWFWWLGGRPLPPLPEVARRYPRRVGIEHGYRFDKQDLLWTAPHLRTPQQMETWTDVVAMVHNEVGLARPLAEARRLPWETARNVPNRHPQKPSAGRGAPPALGGHHPPAHAAPGAPRPGPHYCAGRHTGPSTTTAWKIPRTRSWRGDAPCPAPSRHPQTPRTPPQTPSYRLTRPPPSLGALPPRRLCHRRPLVRARP